MSNIYNFLISQKEKKSFFKYFSLTLAIFSIFFLNFSVSNADEEINPNTPNTFKKGLVSFTFDDGYKSIYTALNDNVLGGYTGTVYMTVNDLVGATEGFGKSVCEEGTIDCYDDYMTKNDLETLVSEGFEVGSHTRTHRVSLINGEEKDFKYEINGSRLDLLKEFNDQKITNLAYPFGEYNDDIIEKLKLAGYIGARTVNPDYLNFKDTDQFKLHARQINYDTELDTVKGWIDEAVEKKGWLILVIHEIEEVECVKYYCTTQNILKDISSYLKVLNEEGKLEVLTVSEGLEKMDVVPSTEEPISIRQDDIKVYTKNYESVPVYFPHAVSPATLEPFCVIKDVWIQSSDESGVYFEQMVESGDEFKVGKTEVSCSITGQNGEVEEVEFSVVVEKATPLTIENLSVLDKEYDGNTEAEVESIDLEGVIGNDNVSVTYDSAIFSGAEVGDNKEVTVKGLSLEGKDAEKYYLEINEITGIASILPKELGVSVKVSDKEYDGNTEAVAKITLFGVIGDDDVSVTYNTATFSDTEVENDKMVTVSGLFLEGSDAENYNLGGTEIIGEANITLKKLEVLVDIKDKEYDGNTEAEVESIDLEGVIGNDNVSVTYDSAIFSGAEVGDNKEVTVKGLSLEGEDSDNYSLEETELTTTASILKKEEQGNDNTSSGGNSSGGSKKSSSGSRGGASGKVLGESTSETDSSEDSDKKESEEIVEVEENEKEESATEENLSVFKFTRSLQIGSIGDDVTELQKRLQKEGFFFGPITGYYGQLTFEAVQKYQAKNGILQAGVVGPITREKLNSNFSGIEGNDSLIQSKLELIEKLKELIKLLTLLEEVKNK